jgi:hypothetical protein
MSTARSVEKVLPRANGLLGVNKLVIGKQRFEINKGGLTNGPFLCTVNYIMNYLNGSHKFKMRATNNDRKLKQQA